MPEATLIKWVEISRNRYGKVREKPEKKNKMGKNEKLQ